MAALLRGRWRKLKRADGGRRALGQLAVGIFIVLTLSPIRGSLSPAAFGRLWSELGLGLWSAWIAGAAVARTDFAWHIRLRPWILRPGIWTSYILGVALGPATPVILGGYIATLLAMVLCLHVAIARLPLVAAVLWLLILGTLRVTSSIRVLTRPGGSPVVRACGFVVAFGFAVWNELAHGLPPMRWLGDGMHAPAAKALWGVLFLPLLLVILCGIDGRLVRWDVLQGRRERRHGSFGALLLGSGGGSAQALRRAAVLSWKAWVWALAVFGALWLPIALPIAHAGSAAGMGPALCGFAMLLPCWARGNMLGADGPGVWRYLCAGVGPAEVLLQRGFAFNLLQAVMLVPSVVLTLALRPAGWTGILAMGAFVAGCLAMMDAAGLLVSRDFPEPDRPSDESGGLTAGGGALALGVAIWDTAFVVAFVFAWPSVAEWFWPAGVAAACLVFRWLVVRSLNREFSNVWSARTLSRLGATWL